LAKLHTPVDSLELLVPDRTQQPNVLEFLQIGRSVGGIKQVKEPLAVVSDDPTPDGALVIALAFGPTVVLVAFGPFGRNDRPQPIGIQQRMQEERTV
jgi:hypothetical protein